MGEPFAGVNMPALGSPVASRGGSEPAPRTVYLLWRVHGDFESYTTEVLGAYSTPDLAVAQVPDARWRCDVGWRPVRLSKKGRPVSTARAAVRTEWRWYDDLAVRRLPYAPEVVHDRTLIQPDLVVTAVEVDGPALDVGPMWGASILSTMPRQET